jgi:hypothetical protein
MLQVKGHLHAAKSQGTFLFVLSPLTHYFTDVMLHTDRDLAISRALEAVVQLGPVGETVRNAMFALGETRVRELMAGEEPCMQPSVWQWRLRESVRGRRAAVLGVTDLFSAATEGDLRTSRAVAQWVAQAIAAQVGSVKAEWAVDHECLQKFALTAKPYLQAETWMRVVGRFMGCACDRDRQLPGVQLERLAELVMAEPQSHAAQLTMCLGRIVVDATAHRWWGANHYLAVLTHWPEGVFHLCSALVQEIDRPGNRWGDIQYVKTVAQEAAANVAFELGARACVYPALVHPGPVDVGLPDLPGPFDGIPLLHDRGTWHQFVHGLYRLAFTQEEPTARKSSAVKGPQARQLAVWGPQALLAAASLDAKLALYPETTLVRLQAMLARMGEHPYLYKSVEWQVALVALAGSLAPSWWADTVKQGSGLVPDLSPLGGLEVLCTLMQEWVGGLVAVHQVWAAQVALAPSAVKALSPLTPEHLATLMTALNKFLHWWCRPDLVDTGVVCPELLKPLVAPGGPFVRLVDVALEQGLTDLRVARGALATTFRLMLVVDDGHVTALLRSMAKPTAEVVAKALVAMDVPRPGLQGVPFVVLSQVVSVIGLLGAPGPDFPVVTPLLWVAVRSSLRKRRSVRDVHVRRTWVGRAFEPSYEYRLLHALAHADFGRRPTPSEAFLQLLLEPKGDVKQEGVWQWLDRHDSFPDDIADGADLLMYTLMSNELEPSGELQAMMQARGMLDDLSDCVVAEHSVYPALHGSHNLDALVVRPRAARWSTPRSAWCTAVARAIAMRTRVLAERQQARAVQRRRVDPL